MTENTSGLTFKLDTYDVQAFSKATWKFINEISIQIDPVQVKMTEQLSEAIMNYFDQNTTD